MMSVSAAEPRFPTRQGKDLLLQKHSGRQRQNPQRRQTSKTEGKSTDQPGDLKSCRYVCHIITPSVSSFISLLLCAASNHAFKCCQPLKFPKYHRVFTVWFYSQYWECVSLQLSICVDLCGCLYLSRGVDSAHTCPDTHTLTQAESF